MTSRTIALAAIAAVILASCAAIHDAAAQGRRPPQQQEESAGPDFFNLGPVGMMGMPGSDGIDVRQVDADGRAAAAGIKVGDGIVAVAGHRFAAGEDVIEVYAAAFDRAEEKDGKLSLELRDGRTVELTLKKTGKHSDTDLAEKDDEALRAAAEYIAGKQQGDGSFYTMLGGNNGRTVVTSLCGLVLMSTGQRGYYGHIDRAAKYVMENAGVYEGFGGRQPDPKWDQTNWGLGYACWFIYAYYELRKDPAAKPALQRFADQLSASQAVGTETGAYNKGGGWAHGPAKNGPNALNYLELEIISNYALAGLAMCKHAGCTVDDAVIKRAQAYIADCTVGSGGVAYSTRRGQFPGTAEPGRTSGALFAMLASGADSGLCGRMSNYIKTLVDRVPFGHGSPCLHMLAGALGANAAGRDNWRTYWGRWRLRIMVCRREDGSFTSCPTKETAQIGNTDLTVGRLWTTANLALILGIRKGHLPTMQGKLKDGLKQPEPEPDQTPAPDPANPGAGEPPVTGGGGSEATPANPGPGPDTPEPVKPDPAPEPPAIVFPKGTRGYELYMNVLTMIVPQGHRALKAESFSESLAMLNENYRMKVEQLAGRMVSSAKGDDQEALKTIRDLASGK
ncbi:MAG: DUF6288 domain-containing protein [Planctomycetota bacterium]